MIDLLLPSTDRAADLQMLIVVACGAFGFFAVRRHRDARLAVTGITVFLLGVMALRSLH